MVNIWWILTATLAIMVTTSWALTATRIRNAVVIAIGNNKIDMVHSLLTINSMTSWVSINSLAFRLRSVLRHKFITKFSTKTISMFWSNNCLWSTTWVTTPVWILDTLSRPQCCHEVHTSLTLNSNPHELPFVCILSLTLWSWVLHDLGSYDLGHPAQGEQPLPLLLHQHMCHQDWILDFRYCAETPEKEVGEIEYILVSRAQLMKKLLSKKNYPKVYLII